MKLVGIELCNFRSIGTESVVLAPLRKCNVIVGQNNAGKSNVLKAVQKISNKFQKETGKRESLIDLDLHRRSPENQFRFKLHFESSDPQDELVRLSGTAPFYFEFSWSMTQGSPSITGHNFAHIDEFTRAQELFRKFGGKQWTVRVNADEIRREFLSLGSNFFTPFLPAIPPVHAIPEFRQIRRVSDASNEYTLDGVNLIALLASYQHPDSGKDQDRLKFDRIERFVRELLHLPDASLDVTHDKTTIMLTNNGLRLPLASYGTGVHELVILVTAALSIENSICCIEEPEIHLHPRLQREFIDFIAVETTNQYLVSTHSPTFINAINTRNDVQVFHLHLENGSTVGGPISREEDTLHALRDLGLKASDILQSNCVLWIEGPSDRIYLKRWLELASPDLVEGRDYSIMFYGGRLLAHLSAERTKVPDELINLLRINQHAVVVMDSDRRKASEDLNETKRRVQEECQRSGSICWVTDGREVENYLSRRVVVAGCGEFAGKQVEFLMKPYTKFDQALSRALNTAGAKNLDYAADKVKYAEKFAKLFGLTDMSKQLRSRVDEVAAKIKFWNE